jgi:hypothetical protein
MRRKTNLPKGFADTDLDIDRLRKEFDKLIALDKAEKLGVSEEDLVVTLRGGRRVFTTRQRLAKDLEKQRSIAGPERRPTQRAIRNGESSVIGDIQSRLEDCFRLLGLLAQSARIAPIDHRDMRVTLKASAANALRYGTELHGIEAEIERKKNEDPLLSRLDELARMVHAAQISGDQETAARLLEENREDLTQYESRRRVLGPDIQSALHCRLGLLREQRRLMRTQMHLYSEWAQAVQERAQDFCAHAESGNLTDRMTSSLKSLAERIETAKRLQAERKGAESSSDKKDVRAQNQLLEEDIMWLRDAIRNIAEHVARLEKLLDKVASGGKGGRRMVFVKRKEES